MSSYRPLSHDEDRPLPHRDDDAITVASSSSSLSARDPVYPTAPLAKLPSIGGNDRTSSGLDGFEDVLAMVQGMGVDADRRSALQAQHDGADDRRQSYGGIRTIAADNMSGPSHEAAAPPPNILDPRDPTFDYNRSSDIHLAYRYSQTAPPLPPPPPPAPERRLAGGDLFEDFDGVHCSPVDERDHVTPSPQPIHHRTRSSTQLHHPRPQTATSPPPSRPGQVYYPAPVPAVLNLPPLLSKPKLGRTIPYTGPGTAGIRSQTPELLTNRRSAHLRGDSKNLPAALRASAFFDNLTPQTVIAPAIKESSAVATLDSILDASALAPPAAFTDHPITGTTATTHIPVHTHHHVHRHSVISLTVKHHPGESPTSSRSSSPEPEPAPAALDPNALPTTLLAELESRKAQQKSRNRTAATSGGIRSTLLELDAVAQVQAQTRRQKRTHLAWEDPEEVPEGDDDEDVPLGVLFHQQPQNVHEDVPLGLLVKKELEDAEPLAKRAARLKREQQRYTLNVDIPSPAVETPEEEDEEGETLAQRRARLRAPKPEEEETLAQRRARLKLREEAKIVQEEVRRRQRESVVGGMGHLGNGSMASVNLAMNRGGFGPGPGMYGGGGPGPGGGAMMGGGGMYGGGGMAGMGPAGGMYGGAVPPGGMAYGGTGPAVYPPPPGAGGMYAAAPMVPPQMAMNAQQREFVERWRSSVM